MLLASIQAPVVNNQILTIIQSEINMSIFSSITTFITGATTHLTDIEATFQKFFHTVPSWTQTASVDIAFVAPILETILAVDGKVALDAQVTKTVTTIQTDLVLAAKFVNAANASQNLVDVLDSIKTNAGDLLTIAAIKDSAHAATITSYISGLIAEIDAILSLISTLPKA